MGVEPAWGVVVNLVTRIVATRSLTSAAVAMLAGGGLLAVGRWVEAGDLDGVVASWRVLTPALGVAGGLMGAARAKALGEVRTLQALGVGRPVWWVGAVVAASLVCLVPLALASVDAVPASGWVRGSGGWIHEGVRVPDAPGGQVLLHTPFPWRSWLLTAGGAALGSLTGLQRWSVTTQATVALSVGLTLCAAALLL